MKLLAILFVFGAPAWAVKGDVSAPGKMAPSVAKGLEKSAPSTEKRVLQLQLKK